MSLITGTMRLGAGYCTQFEGWQDEFGVWDKVLTQQEITDLYNSGNGLQY